MKTNFKSVTLFVLAAVALSPCSSDGDAALIKDAPTISNF